MSDKIRDGDSNLICIIFRSFYYIYFHRKGIDSILNLLKFENRRGKTLFIRQHFASNESKILLKQRTDSFFSNTICFLKSGADYFFEMCD